MQQNNAKKNEEIISYNEPKITKTENPRKESYIRINKPEIYFNLIEKQIRKSPQYAKLFINTNRAEVLTIETESIPNDIYLTKIKDKTILEILLNKYKKVIDGLEIERRTKRNPEILEIYLKNNKNVINIENTDEFLLKKINGKTLLEYTLDNIGYDLKEDVADLKNRVKTNSQINEIVINYLIKQETLNENQLYIIESIIEGATPENRIKLYEKHLKALKENKNLKHAIEKNLDKQIIDYFFKIKEYDIFKEIINEDILNIKMDENNTLFSTLIENKITNINTYFRVGPLLKKLVDNNMYKTLEKIVNDNYSLLLKKYDNANTVLEVIINKFDIELRLSKFWRKIKEYSNNDTSYARIYLKNDKWSEILTANDSVMDSKYDENHTFYEVLIGYVENYIDRKYESILSLSPMSKRILLHKYKNQTVLEYLLKNGSKHYVLFNIENNNLQRNIEIQTILKLNNIDIKKEFENHDIKYNIDYAFDEQKNKIIKEKYIPYLEKNIDDEKQNLINQMRIIFLEDGRSDNEIIELACNAFKYSFVNNYKYTERDLNTLINIKINNPEFILLKGTRSVFDNMGIIMIDKIYDVDTFNHELGHAIHWYATEDKIPDKFQREKIETDEEKFKEFIQSYLKTEKNTIEKLQQEKKDYYCENVEAQKDAKEYRKRMERILEEAEENNLYEKEIIDYLKNNITVEEEYKEYYNRVTRQEFAYLYQEDYKTSIIDIIDALKKGKIFDYGMSYDGLNRRIGHGSDYFKRNEKVFTEIVAEYHEIIKSPHREIGLKTLESIVGKEMIELLEEFNEELVVEPKKIEKHR